MIKIGEFGWTWAKCMGKPYKPTQYPTNMLRVFSKPKGCGFLKKGIILPNMLRVFRKPKISISCRQSQLRGNSEVSTITRVNTQMIEQETQIIEERRFFYSPFLLSSFSPFSPFLLFSFSPFLFFKDFD